MPKRNPEQQLSNEGALRVGSQPDVRLFRNNVGTLIDSRGIPVKFGLMPGSADHIGIVGPYGRFLSIEWKRPGYVPPSERKLNEALKHAQGCKCEPCHYNAQLRWRDIIRAQGGVAGIVDSVVGALDLVDEARQPAQEKGNVGKLIDMMNGKTQ